MPQMAPLNWTILMIFSISVLMIFIVSNYYNLSVKPKSPLKSYYNKMNFNSWKW